MIKNKPGAVCIRLLHTGEGKMTLKLIYKILVENWPMFLRGAGMTLYISIISTILGSIIGLIVGVIRTIPMPERGFKKSC